MLAEVVSGYVYDDGLTYKYDTDTHTAILTGKSSISALKVEIPASIMDENVEYAVTGIGYAALKANQSIEHVVIP